MGKKKTVKRNNKLKRERLVAYYDARTERLSHVMSETTGVGAQMDLQLPQLAPKPAIIKKVERLVVVDPMELVPIIHKPPVQVNMTQPSSGGVKKGPSKKQKRLERSRSLVRKLK